MWSLFAHRIYEALLKTVFGLEQFSWPIYIYVHDIYVLKHVTTMSSHFIPLYSYMNVLVECQSNFNLYRYM